MRFANPAGLWLALLAIPVLLLHVLKPRRQAVEVSSTFLWREVARPVSAATPWQRLRPSLLLFLQLLTVLGLAVAVARPVRLTDAPLAQHTVFIIDASGSMAALDGSPDRLAEAKDRARELRRELPHGGVASVVVADDRPRVALSASADGRGFEEALAPIEVTEGSADFAGAFTLAESLETPGTPIGFVLLSDGGLTDAEQRQLPPGTTYEAIGDLSTNRAITRLAVEPRGSGLHAIVTVRNTGGPAATQTLRVDVDGKTVHTAALRLGRGDAVDEAVDLPAGDRVEAFLEGEDLLDADDHAYAVAPRRRDLKVLVAGADNPFLDTLLAAIPGVTVERSATPVPAPGRDLAIYDQVAVPADPQAPFLAIAPPGGAPGVTVTGKVERPAVALVQATDALVDGVDLTEVAIAEAQRLVAPTAATVVGAEGTPLLLRGSLGGRTFLYLGFAVESSNLPVQIAFPILGDRIISELAGAALPPGAIEVGVPLPVDAAAAATVTAPTGTTTEVPAGAPAPIADRSGYWTVTTKGKPARTVAVNPSPAESSLTPAPSLLTEKRQTRPGERAPTGEVPALVWVAVPLLALLAAEWLAARRRSGVSRRQWRAATVLRVLVALLLIGALLDLAVVRPAGRVATVFLIDGSDSLGAGGKGDAVGWVRDALDAQPPGAKAGIALFGGDARLELTVQDHPRLTQPTVKIDSSRTNLATALRLAAAVLPTDARRRIVLISDGRPTEGETAREAARLKADGIELEVHPVSRAGSVDVAVSSVKGPGRARQGEQITLTATVAATRAGPGVVTLLLDGDVVEERVVDLAVGDNEVAFTVIAGAAGLARYQVRVTGSGDTVVQNNSGYAAIQIDGPATVLVLEGATGDAAVLADALRAGGLNVEVKPATSLPPVDRLASYTATVLVDVDARTLTLDQIATLTAATRDLGRGLVSIGGTHSYGVGGYLGSDLEKLLPVISEILDPKRRQTVAEVLSIDTSGSMVACHCAEGSNGMASGGNRADGGVNKTDISRAAAARTIQALGQNDEVGILAFDSTERWVIDLQKLPSQDVVTSGLRTLQPTGQGTDLRESLSKAAEALRKSKASLKHIILFTDGFTNPDHILGLADEAAKLRDEGITVSVLATGEGAAHELAQVAEKGGGRFYPGTDLQRIPQIMQEEAIIASRDFITEGEFLPEITSSTGPAAGLTSSPPLLGYVATTAKPAASTLLRIGPDHDPLLASWQVGLGRATSWTSDASRRWSQLWAGWDGYVDFWTAVVKDSFAAGTGQGLVTARVADGVLKVTVESEEAFPDGAEATARVTSPDLQGTDLRLERVAGGTFAGELPITGAGTFAVGAQVTGPDGTLLTGTGLATQSYSAEYQPGDTDEALLKRLSAATGGRGAITPVQSWDRADLAAGRSRYPLAGWFLLLAALLWPVAVGLSRLALRGTVTARVRHAGATAVWALRSKAPSLPGRDRAPTARPAPPPRPEREAAPVPEAKAPATIGSLLESQRRRRAGGDDGSDDPPPG